MSKLGTKNNPVVIRTPTEKRAKELLAYCDERGWVAIVGIEPNEKENIDDIKKMEKDLKPSLNLKPSLARNAPCPCGSGKQYKRCCGQ